MMEIYDIAIIGTGPAGVSAAITATIRNKKIILFGSRELSDKIRKAHLIQNYPGLPECSGEDLSNAFAAHLEKMGIEITEEKINAVYPMGETFALQTMKNEMHQTRSVILASGMVQGKLLPGEEELVGRGVSYCATCDAPLYRGRSVAVIGYSPEAEEEVNFLSEVASEVLYFPVYRDEPKVSESVKVLRQIPQAILNKEAAEEAFSLAQADPAKSSAKAPDSAKAPADSKALSAASDALSVDALKQGQLAVQTAEGAYPVDGIFVLRSGVPTKQLIPGIEMDGEHVKVNLQMETSVPGCFACGDITGRPYQYVKAAGQGNVAALSAVSYLDQK
mgnify:CR=1 FL=1